MRILVTGATGFIGFAVTTSLSRAGHEVLGLTRHPDNARRLEAVEAKAVVGEMAAPDMWLQTAAECDVVIHCAAESSSSYMKLDRQTVEHVLSLAPPLFIYTSGCWLYGNTGHLPADETTLLRPPAMVQPRVETERAVLAANSGTSRTLILRPGCVYGGSGGLTGTWFDSAENEGASRVIGDGRYRWAMVHLVDLAELYCLAAASPLGGEIFNAVDGMSSTVHECADAASRAVLGTSALAFTPWEDASYAMGPVAECLTLDQRLDAAKATRLLGWRIRQPAFVSAASRYYRSWRAFH